MAEAVVCFVLESLHDLLIEEAQFLRGVKHEVEQIKKELERMRAFLKDADARQDQDERIRILVSQTRELAHDTEDILEMYAFKIPLEKNSTFLGRFASIFRDGATIHHVGSQIQQIKKDISELITSMQSYGIRAIREGESSRFRRPKRSYHHFVEHDFVGLEDDLQALIAHLVDEDGNSNGHCRVVSVCGMGGLGKSTIARKVYHHPDIRQKFQAFAWASISHQWQTRDVLESLITKLLPERREEIAGLREHELLDELYKVQQMKKCLVVLDDIWSSGFWECLHSAFPLDETGSKIIITTRKKEVAMQVDSSCFFYEPRFLSPEESWELLQKKAFPRQCTPDPNLAANTERIGREMAVKCGGLPLAIIVLGGILSAKSRFNEWEEVHRNLDLYLRRDRGHGKYGTVYEVLSLSYNDLPYHLKHCFLHLGSFPEDYRIPARKLFQLWTAEGFISPESHQGKGEETMMDVGRHYLDELAKRSMVQVLEVDESTGRVKSCRLHDLMRDVCLSKGKEENFLRIISQQDEHEPSVPLASSSRTSTSAVRRLSVAVTEDLECYFPPRGEKIERVRSALFFSKLSRRKPLQSTIVLLSTKCQLLRILDLEKSDFGKKLPKVIGNLTRLRFLSFRNCQVEKLPSSIGNLKYLQTLDLRVTFFSHLKMPDVLWKLQHLRHLYLPPSHGNTEKLQLGSLSRLETLKNFDSRFYEVRDLMNLNKLRKLSATFMLQVDDLEVIIRYLIDSCNSNHLRDVTLRIIYKFQTEKELSLLSKLLGCCHLRKLDLIGSIKDLPHHSHFSLSLTTLTLRKSELSEDPMATLEKLPRLSSLALRGNAFAGKKMRISPQGFPQLRTLQLEGLQKLKKWKVEEGALPNLLHLEIDGCEKLKMVPDGLKFLSSVKELLIANMPDIFNRRLKIANEKEGADYGKIQHIPSIRFRDTSKDVKLQLPRQQTGRFLPGLLHSFSPSTVPKSWQTL